MVQVRASIAIGYRRGLIWAGIGVVRSRRGRPYARRGAKYGPGDV